MGIKTLTTGTHRIAKTNVAITTGDSTSIVEHTVVVVIKEKAVRTKQMGIRMMQLSPTKWEGQLRIVGTDGLGW